MTCLRVTFADTESLERWLDEQAEADADLDAALDAESAARERFDALDTANRFAILYRVQRAKTPEKRAAKTAEMVAMLSRGDTTHHRKAKRSR